MLRKFQVQLTATKNRPYFYASLLTDTISDIFHDDAALYPSANKRKNMFFVSLLRTMMIIIISNCGALERVIHIQWVALSIF